MRFLFMLAAAASMTTSSISMSTRDLTMQIIKTDVPAVLQNHKGGERLGFALQMARQAGEAILSVKKDRNLQVEIKQDQTPVTAADHASNVLICELVHNVYPQDGILSEEVIKQGNLNDAIAKGVDAEWTWVIDPLDGTKAFIKSVEPNTPDLDKRYQGMHYGVHIGLLHEGEPVLGVNYYPEIDTLYFALDGFAYKQAGDESAMEIFNQPVSGIRPVLNPTDKERDRVHPIYEKLMGKEAAEQFKEQGCFLDSFGFKMVCIAEGNGCNLFIAPAGGPGFWDVGSMIPFVEAVGGQVTDWEGNSINFRDMSQKGLLPKGVIISMDPDVHEKIVAIIAELNRQK